MRKYSWILALLAALAMIFVGCGDSGGGGGGGVEDPYVIPVDTKFIQISLRSANWHSIDIRGGLGFASQDITDYYTEDSAHTISVFGRAVGASNIYFSGAQGSGAGGNAALSGHTFTPGEKGEFTLVREFTWEEISRSNDIRIAGIDAGIAVVNFYEIEIKDAAGVVVYALSEDPDVQSKDHGFEVLTEGGATTTWLKGALGGTTPNAIGKVFDPETAKGPCCTDCEAGCSDCENGMCDGDDECGVTCCMPPFTLAALEALSGGITVTPVGNALPVFDAETKVATFTIVKLETPDGNNTAASSGIQFTWEQAGITNWDDIGLKQSVKITYAAVIESGTPDMSVKKDAGTNWGNAGDINYPTLAGGPSTVLTYTKTQIGAASTGITITANSYNKENPAAVYYVKILKVEITACPDCEELVCTCFVCGCLCEDCIEAEECDGSDCDDGCVCTCHVIPAFNITVDLEEFATTVNSATAVGAVFDDGILTATFTEANQWLCIALSDEDAAKVAQVFYSGKTVTFTITGTVDKAMSLRVGFRDTEVGSNFAGSLLDNQPFAAEATSITGVLEKHEQMTSGDANVSSFAVQSRSGGPDGVLTITAITISYSPE